jgi:hypothetical protein
MQIQGHSPTNRRGAYFLLLLLLACFFLLEHRPPPEQGGQPAPVQAVTPEILQQEVREKIVLELSVLNEKLEVGGSACIAAPQACDLMHMPSD